MSKSMTSIESLPRDALLKCLAHVGSGPDADDERRNVIPLVCKEWADVSALPSELWRQVAVDAAEHRRRSGRRLRWAQLRRWLQKRAGGVEELTLRLHHAAPANALAPLYPALAPRLRALNLELERVLSSDKAHADLAGLSALSGLRQLTLVAPAAPAAAVSQGLEEGLAGLTCLEELSLSLHASMFTALRPAFPEALGGLVGLRRLTLDIAGFAAAAGGALPSALSRLRHLEELTLLGDWRHPDAAFPASFEDLPALRRLTLRQLHLMEAAPPVRGLSALTHLTLQDCTGRFFAAAGLRSLRLIDMERCDELHFDEEARQLLDALPDLRVDVAVTDSYTGEMPQWMMDMAAVHLLDRRTRK